ncbi:winged helix-turn-helix transcriptional regulator [Candidatus Saccharibacteria bacterium]|nr:winged helix-turn-helix transcriptional regulator [Candidatus Saccharibacteria bacterium]
MADSDFAAIFSALGDKTRFKLFQLIASEPQGCVSQMAEHLKISPACVSQHMKILADAGLVTRVRHGQRVCYTISTDSPSKQLLSELIFNTKATTRGPSLQKELQKL